jgi:hypothetical protein
MAFGSSSVANSKFSEVQVIDAFANYFKHKAEWAGDWDKLKTLQLKTAQIIQAVGASQESTGNLRTGSKVLGNETYTNISTLAIIE